MPYFPASRPSVRLYVRPYLFMYARCLMWAPFPPWSICWSFYLICEVWIWYLLSPFLPIAKPVPSLILSSFRPSHQQHVPYFFVTVFYFCFPFTISSHLHFIYRVFEQYRVFPEDFKMYFRLLTCQSICSVLALCGIGVGVCTSDRIQENLMLKKSTISNEHPVVVL